MAREKMLFDKTCMMGFIYDYIIERFKMQPLGSVSLKDGDSDDSFNISTQEIYIDGRATGITVAYADYAEWLEKKYLELYNQKVVEVG